MTTQSNGQGVMIQGRIVWVLGDLFAGKIKTDYDTNQPIVDTVTGQPIREYGFGIAIPKVDPRTGQPTEEYTKVWSLLHREAFTLYPSGHIPPDFAMKYKDGDGIDHNGKLFSDREGYKGHLVLNCTTQIAMKCFRFEGGNNVLVNDGIKCGDYVNVQLTVKAHPAKGRGKAGLYLSPIAVQLIQPGKEIINTPSGDQMFGSVAPAYKGEVVAPVYAPMPTQAAPVAPSQPAPHYGVVPQGLQPQNAPAYPAPVSPPMGNVAPAPAMPSLANSAPTAYPSSAIPPMPGMPK